MLMWQLIIRVWLSSGQTVHPIPSCVRGTSILRMVSGESDLNMLPVVAGNELLIVLCDDQLSIFPDSREFMNQIRQK
jgi:hypothetical protein